MDSFEASVVIDKPIEQVFDFLVDGENDKKFSARVQSIKKVTDGLRVATTSSPREPGQG
jgi:uncharacterized protein YndB with AHSA1/START domain